MLAYPVRIGLFSLRAPMPPGGPTGPRVALEPESCIGQSGPGEESMIFIPAGLHWWLLKYTGPVVIDQWRPRAGKTNDDRQEWYVTFDSKYLVHLKLTSTLASILSPCEAWNIILGERIVVSVFVCNPQQISRQEEFLTLCLQCQLAFSPQISSNF